MYPQTWKGRKETNKHGHTLKSLLAELWPPSDARLSVDLVVHLGESRSAVQLLPHLVVQRVVEHLPVLLAGHVWVGVHHLEPEPRGDVSCINSSTLSISINLFIFYYHYQNFIYSLYFYFFLFYILNQGCDNCKPSSTFSISIFSCFIFWYWTKKLSAAQLNPLSIFLFSFFF